MSDFTLVINPPAKIAATLSVGQGPAGPPGATSGDLSYDHFQASASDTWVIDHGLNKHPVVTVIDSAGSVCEGHVNYVTSNQVVLTFSAAFGGHAYLN